MPPNNLKLFFSTIALQGQPVAEQRGIGAFAREVARRVKGEDLFESIFRFNCGGVNLGGLCLDQRSISRRVMDFGVTGFTVRTSPRERETSQALINLFEAVVNNDREAFHAVLANAKIFKDIVLAAKKEVTVEAGSAAQIKVLYRKMIAANPRWRVYLSLGDIKHVGRMLNYPKDETIFGSATRQKTALIYRAVTEKRLGLFTRYAFAETSKGFALKKVISMVLVGRFFSFGASTQKQVANGFAIRYRVDPDDRERNPHGSMSIYEQSFAELDALVLLRIRHRQSFFDAESGQLKANLRQRILAINTKYPKDLLDAVEELEELLRGI